MVLGLGRGRLLVVWSPSINVDVVYDVDAICFTISRRFSSPCSKAAYLVFVLNWGDFCLGDDPVHFARHLAPGAACHSQISTMALTLS